MIRSYLLFVLRRKTRPSCIHQVHARIGIRTVGVELRAQFQNHRINFDRGDRLHALRQRGRRVGAGARAENQRVFERSVRERVRTPADRTAPYSARGSCSDARCC